MSVPRSKKTRSAPTTAPLRYARPVRFGDTDAAGIAYTGRIPDMALEALEVWFRDRLGLDWYENLQGGRVDVPCVHLAFDFRSPMTPRDSLEIAVLLERASSRSFQVRLIARAATTLRWRARFVFASVDGKTFRAAPIPRSWQPHIDRELALAAATGPLDAWHQEPGASAALSRPRRRALAGPARG